MEMKCQAKTWMQLQKQHGPDDPVLAEFGCTRPATMIADGRHACTHHGRKPSPFGWNDA